MCPIETSSCDSLSAESQVASVISECGCGVWPQGTPLLLLSKLPGVQERVQIMEITCIQE